MYKHHREAFDEIILGGDPGTPTTFWNAVRDSTEFKAHPVSGQDDLHLCIPLALHGDGVPCTGVSRSWSQGVDCWSVTSLLARGPTIRYWCVLSMLWQEACDAGTLKAFWLTLAWSFYWLQKGEWPRVDQHKKASWAPKLLRSFCYLRYTMSWSYVIVRGLSTHLIHMPITPVICHNVFIRHARHVAETVTKFYFSCHIALGTAACRRFLVEGGSLQTAGGQVSSSSWATWSTLPASLAWRTTPP